MSGMKFQYDEEGTTFYYFLLSTFLMILLPMTYFFWPTKSEEDESDLKKPVCQCDPCEIKRYKEQSNKPRKALKRKLIKGILLCGWVAFVALAYKVSQIEVDVTEYDPFQILNIDRSATEKAIRAAYRKLSLKHHPDRGGSQKQFMLINKAYESLTKEEARKNWEEYGNPDGPGALKLGIALPKWIVDEKNSGYALIAYTLIFMILLPVSVGTWWYRSIRYTSDQILMGTTHIYYYFISKSPNMLQKRALMILSGSFEFDQTHNPEIVLRPTDDEEVTMILKHLPDVDEKQKDQPFCYPCSLKARALIHAHLSRLPLSERTLLVDKNYIIAKTPYLIQEMVNTSSQLVAWSKMDMYKGKPPSLETVENIMKLSPMIIQALWSNKSPFLQLPHVREDMLRHFVTKKRHIRTLRELALLSDDERRSLFRTLSPVQYQDVVLVLSQIPVVTLDVHTEVKDEEDSTITADSLVSLTVRLVRSTLGVVVEESRNVGEQENLEVGVDGVENEESEKKNTQKANMWDKKKKLKQKKKPKKGKPKKVLHQKVSTPEAALSTPVEVGENEPDLELVEKMDVEDFSVPGTPVVTASKREIEGDVDDSEEEREEWYKEFQEKTRRDAFLETKSRTRHKVHCPYFPLEKEEYWWIYLVNRKDRTLITSPLRVTSLDQEDEVELKFSTPSKPGTYHFNLCLRSDSYLDVDVSKTVKIDVHEAKLVLHHKQWDISDEEEAEDDDESYSESSYEED